MSELKRCPFCGSEPTVTNEFDDEVLFYGCTKDIDCPLYDAPFVNLENWNARPIEDALNARIAELEGFIDQLIEIGEWGVTGMVIATSFSGGEIHDLAERRQNEWLTLVKDWKEREK